MTRLCVWGQAINHGPPNRLGFDAFYANAVNGLFSLSDGQMRKVSRRWLGGVSAMCMAVGWWVLDVGYTAQGQTISGLTMDVVGLAVLSCLVSVLGWLKPPHTSQGWIGVLWLQGAGQVVLTLELWVFGMPASTLWAMGLAPTMGVLALVSI